MEGVGSVGGLAADASKGIDASVRLEEVVVKAVQPTTVASVSKAFIKGFGKDLWGAVKGTAHALIHIDQTAVTIAKLQNPVDQQFMGIAAYQTLRGTTERFRNGNANDKAEIIGAGVGEIAQLFGGELAEVGKIGEIGKLSEVTSDIAKITEEVDKTAVIAKTGTEVLDGSFSITELGWQGYPQGIPKPNGPFRLLQGEEYAAARAAANNANRALSKELGLQNKFVDIHEITPVKFGGDPTNINNKIFLDRAFHQSQITPFWNKKMSGIQ